jgi:hypothetical protein
VRAARKLQWAVLFGQIGDGIDMSRDKRRRYLVCFGATPLQARVRVTAGKTPRFSVVAESSHRICTATIPLFRRVSRSWAHIQVALSGAPSILRCVHYFLVVRDRSVYFRFLEEIFNF